MYIQIPTLKSSNALEIIRDFGNYSREAKEKFISTGETSDFSFDFCNVYNYEPFAMLICAKFVKACHKSGYIKTKYYTNLKDSVHGYGGSMQFFESMGIPYGKKVNERRGSSNHVPVTVLTKQAITKSFIKKSTDFNTELISLSIEFANVLTRDMPIATQSISFIIREMLRNVFEHSEDDSAFICAQYWKTKDIVELAISDSGIGIFNSLVKNINFTNRVTNNRDAIAYSLKPGVSKIPVQKIKSSRYNPHDNSGFGLYMASELCTKLGGSFIIHSQDTILVMEENNFNYYYGIEDSFPGTTIKMTIKPSHLINYDSIFNEILVNGEKLAVNFENAISKASRLSRSKS